jgi:hypothetical protein
MHPAFTKLRFPTDIQNGKYQLQEVLACTTSACRNSALIFRHSTEDTEFWVQILAYIHDRCYISAAIAIVRCRPDSYYGFLREMILLDVSDNTDMLEMWKHTL